MSVDNEGILRARLKDRARNGMMRLQGMSFKQAENFMTKYNAGDYLKQCELDITTKDLVNGMIEFCLKRRNVLLEPYRKIKYSINGKPIRHLYIIGNGFDRHHGAKSSYEDFHKYLLKRNQLIVMMFELFFGPKSMINSFGNIANYLLCPYFDAELYVPETTWTTKYLWKDFEKNLSELNRERIFDFVDECLSRMSEDDEDFSYADFLSPINLVEEVVNLCSHDMQYHFHRWINTIHYKKGFRKNMLNLDSNAAFLNFNYTLFLESEYFIPRDHILYIHGHRQQKFGTLVLGHNVEDEDASFKEWVHKHKIRRRYRPNLKDKKGNYFANDKLVYLTYFLKDEKKGNWRDPIRFYAADYTEHFLESYYTKNIKHCNDIIDTNLGFFESMSYLEKITVLGHSLGEVDFPYFKAIVENTNNTENLVWNFSYHNDNDILNIRKFCKRMNIPQKNNVQLFQMSKDK